MTSAAVTGKQQGLLTACHSVSRVFPGHGGPGGTSAEAKVAEVTSALYWALASGVSADAGRQTLSSTSELIFTLISP